MKNIIYHKIALWINFVIVFALSGLPFYSQEYTPTHLNSEHNTFQIHSIKSSNNTYIIPRYVIGAGGVIGASGTNHIHSGTTGEVFVGGMQSSNIFLFSGFWHQQKNVPTAVVYEIGESFSEKLEMYQNYPNPFHSQTTIRYNLPNKYLVTVEIFNVMGKRIRLLLNAQNQKSGIKTLVWDGRDEQGNLLGTGMYLYRITIVSQYLGDDKSYKVLFQDIKKMLLVK